MAYNLVDLRGRVRTKLNDSSYSGSAIDGYINDAIVEIADLYPWTYFQRLVSGSLTVGEHTYDQQTDHQTTTKMVLLNPDHLTSHWDITKYRMPWEDFFNTFAAPDTMPNAQPHFWTEYGNQIYFNCPADLAYILRQYYQKIPAELVDDTDVPELPINFRESIVLGATYRAEEERENFDIVIMLQNRFSSRTSDLIARFSNDSMTGPDTVVTPTTRSRDPREGW